MFRKKANDKTDTVTPKENRSINTPNEVNTQVEISSYAPNIRIEPKDYQKSEILNNLATNFDGICLNFLSKANPDEFNSSYMDAVIDRSCIEAIEFMKLQRSNHEKLIKTIIHMMHQGDYDDATHKLEDLLKDKEENERLKAKYRMICFKGTSLEE